MVAFFRVYLHQFLRVLVCAYIKKWFLFLMRVSIKMFAYSLVRLNQDFYIFSCASTSILFPFSRAHLHQSVCFYLGAPALKCLHFSCASTSIFPKLYFFSCWPFFVCIYISFACTCVRLHEFWFFFLARTFIRMVAFTHVCLHQNSCFYPCAPSSKNGSYFSCASS